MANRTKATLSKTGHFLGQADIVGVVFFSPIAISLSKECFCSRVSIWGLIAATLFADTVAPVPLHRGPSCARQHCKSQPQQFSLVGESSRGNTIRGNKTESL